MSQFAVVTTETSRDEIVKNLVEVTELPAAIVKRFVVKFNVRENDCWEWRAASNDPKYGGLPYGRFYFEGKFWVAHRWLYEQAVGVVPGNLVLDHFKVPSGDCIGARCVNPNHLEPVTNRENILRGSGRGAQNAKKTHCAKGHKYDRTDKRGFRICTKCAREYAKNYRAGAK
ncbi:HNH endonuclease [Nonomuraea sp. NBC_00507]|uniref:hypothetical protein n=1 Tax=Nonomuraea sp. NBC_00507 TaxID=2976002 RepID=UPI002E16F49F